MKSSDDAQLYVSAILGGVANDVIKAQALDSIGAMMEFLTTKQGWSHLLRDTSIPFAVACSSPPSITLTTVVANGFQNVLKGMTITGTSIPAGTVVVSVESNLSLTMSLAASAIISGATITFGGTIPLIAGVDTYKLPSKFDRPYSARLVGANKWPLGYVRQNLIDFTTWDQTIPGPIVEYTIYNGGTEFDPSGTQQSYVRVRQVPQTNDTLLLRYYRFADVNADPIDWTDRSMYLLLDLASLHLLTKRNATDSRIPSLRADLAPRLYAALDRDTNDGGEDQREGFISQSDALQVRGIQFYPSGDR